MLVPTKSGVATAGLSVRILWSADRKRDYYLLCWVMVKIAKRRVQVEPDPKWLPVADAVFLHSSREHFTLSYRWSNAPRAIEVDHGSRTFRLHFNDGGVIQLPPWEFLKDDDEPQNGLAGAFVFWSVSEVWNLLIQRFARSVSEGHYKLFGRPETLQAAFEPIPRDHWNLYRIADWSNGTASSPDGRCVWSIHACPQSQAKHQSGRPSIYDQETVDDEVRRLFRCFGRYGREKEKGWRVRADLEDRIAQFLSHRTGQVPVKSTLQDLVKKALLKIDAESA
jgi:hypothetical protein